jgi:Tol biopolymer transport system component
MNSNTSSNNSTRWTWRRWRPDRGPASVSFRTRRASKPNARSRPAARWPAKFFAAAAAGGSDRRRLVAAFALGLIAFAVPLPAGDSAGFLTIAQGNVHARPADSASASISADGRFVAFLSYAPLASADVNRFADIYVLDRSTGGVSLETPEYAERAFDSALTGPRLSGDGRLLVYVVSGAPETGAGAARTIMVRDRTSGITRALLAGGDPPNGDSRDPWVTADGRTVVFASSSTNLAEIPDANGMAEDVFAADITTRAIRRISVDANGRHLAAGASYAPVASHDGRYVVFSSTAPLDGAKSVTDGARARVDVYCRDTRLGVTVKISETSEGAAGNGSSYDASISGDGRFVAFVSDATNLAGRRDRNGAPDVYLRDLLARTTSLVSRSDRGGPANGPSRRPALSADGSVLVFQSDASDLTCGARCRMEDRDLNLVSDIFALDRAGGSIRRVSAGRTAWMEPSIGPVVDGSGTVIAFSSRRPRHGRDDREDYDLFVRAPISSAGRGGFPR